MAVDPHAHRQSAVSLVTCCRVRFHESDPNGHANNAVLVGMLEQAGMDYMAAGGWSQARTRAEFDAAFVTRQYQVEFRQLAFEDDVLVVHARCLQMTGAKAIAAYELRRIAGDPFDVPPTRLVHPSEPLPFAGEDLIVRAQTVYAFTNLSRGRPVRIPEAIIDTFFLPPVDTVQADMVEREQRVAS